MVYKKDLVDKLNKIRNSILLTERKYFHLESIENFITHLEEIRNDRIKEKTSIELMNYLEVIEETSKSNIDLEETYKHLFLNYIYKIADVYQDEAGFIQKPYFPLLFLVLCGLFITLLLLTNLIVAITSAMFLSILAFFYYRSKLKNKRFY